MTRAHETRQELRVENLPLESGNVKVIRDADKKHGGET